MRLPNQYEASARLYVDADAVLTPLLKGLTLDPGAAGQLDLLQRTLLSRPNLEKLISKTDLELRVNGPVELEAMVAQLGTAIKLVPQTRNLFTISYRTSDPKLAYDVVQTILSIFIETKSGTSRTDMANARDFIESQISLYEGKLREAEGKRAAFRTQYLDLLPDTNGGPSRVDAAATNLLQLQGQLIDATSKRDRLTKELAATPATIVVETDPGQLPGGASGGELAAAQAKLRELLVVNTPNHPDVIAQRQLVAALRNGGAASAGSPGRPPRTRSDVNPVYNQLRLGLIDTAAQVESLQRQVGDATREHDRLLKMAQSAPGVEAQYANLDRDYGVIRKEYEELLGRRESMRLSAAADIGAEKVKLQVVDPPQIPRIPVGPRRIVFMWGVLVFGIAGGLGMAVLRMLTDRSFQNLADLRSLGLPIAGNISRFAGRSGNGRTALSASAVAAAFMALCLTFVILLWQVSQNLSAT